MKALYWIIKDNQTAKDLFWITPENDLLPLTDFRTWNCIGRLESLNHERPGEYIIIHSVIPPEIIQALSEEIEGDPLTLAATEYLGITHQYGGQDLPELYQRVLEMYGVDISGNDCLKGYENGHPIYGPWLIASSMGPAIIF